ncbi:MAG: hypothetical protein WCQ50_17610 [Spirochaetota bacterium]
MNRNSLILLAVLVLIFSGMFAMADYQRGQAQAPGGVTRAVSSGGLIINSVIIPGDTAPLAGTGTESGGTPATAAPGGELPALPAAVDGAACP